MEIAIATKNKGKIKEINYFFRESTIRWLIYEDFGDFPSIEENGNSFFENARIKAEGVSAYTGKITLADDSGLEVDCLGGRPGIFSSRYAGDNATDRQNREKLLEELKEFSSPEKRSARFVCSMVLWDPLKGLAAKTEGICKGYITFVEKGSGGFGYDCIFIPEGYRKTMAELSEEEKNSISHRGRALMALREKLRSAC